MLNAKRKIFGCIALAMLVTGCASTGLVSSPGRGAVYHESAENVVVTGKQLGPGAGIGVACATNIMGLVTVGDASAKAAMQSANIKDPVIIDKTFEHVLGFWGRSCTVVRGN
jgi:hypothetical protein